MAREPTADRASRRLVARLEWKVRLARAALAWERLWAALWPLPLIVGVFLCIALFDLLPMVEGWIHLLLLAAFALAAVAVVARAVRLFVRPTRHEAQRRVETSSRLKHRPLSTFGDRPVGSDLDAASLWSIHVARLRGQLRSLRIGPPRSRLPVLDPMATRGGIAVVLFVAVVVAGDTAGDRVARAFSPGVGSQASVPPTVDLWVEPPPYTALAPIYAAAGQPVLRFPAGSKVISRVGGVSEVPTLRLDEEATAFEVAGERSYEASMTVPSGERLAVLQDEAELASWGLEVTPDSPPVVAFARAPATTPHHALRVDYEGDDDYGITELRLEVRRLAEDETLTEDPAFEIPLPVAGDGARKVQGSTYNDLTAHRWAGLPVEMVVVGRDGAGQTGTSEPVRIILPERQFTHPVARAIVEERKKLGLDPGSRLDVARALGGLSRLGSLFDDDTVVHLALSSAKWRLRYDEGPEGIEAVRSLLWDTALRLEDGNLTLAERELRDAQKELMEALARDAPDAEIDRLMERLAQAIDNFLRSLAQNAPTEELSPQDLENAQILDQQDLREMLERMRELAKSGSRDAAMQMLAQLQQMLENLRQARMAQQSQQNSAEMMRMMQELQDLANRQRGLMDETFRQSQQQGQQQGQQQPGQQGMQPGQGQGSPMSLPQLGQQQEQLRRMLGDFMRRLGEQSGDIPGAFGRAEQAMREALEALGQQAPGEAIGPQSQALDQLQQAGQAMARELARQMGQQPGQQGQARQDGQPPGSDPLGRPPGGTGVDTQNVQIPEESDMQRARRIRDELYRRSGDRERPLFEREYIDRLLERF